MLFNKQSYHGGNTRASQKDRKGLRYRI